MTKRAMSIFAQILRVSVLLGQAAACDTDVRSQGDNGTFNAAGGGGVKYEADSGQTRLPLDGSVPSSPTCAEYCDAYVAECGAGLVQVTARTGGPDGGTIPVSDAGAQVLGTSGYLDRATCLSLCEAMPKGEFVVGADEAIEAPLANTLVCRQAILRRAADSIPALSKAERCAIAGPLGVTSYDGSGGTSLSCGDACESYCVLAVSKCGNARDDGGALQLWSSGNDTSACLLDCSARGAVVAEPYANGLIADDRNNTLNCRMLQLERATSNVNACREVGWLLPDMSVCLP
jgi:hypothetical protein